MRLEEQAAGLGPCWAEAPRCPLGAVAKSLHNGAAGLLFVSLLPLETYDYRSPWEPRANKVADNVFRFVLLNQKGNFASPSF